MTKLNRINDATNTRNGGERVRTSMQKTDTTSRASIPLKTLHNDILKANAKFAMTPKQMRVVLRKEFANIHERNSSWTFTQSQYDRVRSHFDPAYATRIARASKRNAKKAPAKTPAPVVTPETTNA